VDGQPWDLILFRNVVIYFEDAHATLAWEKLYSQLAPGGVIVTGSADKPPHAVPFVRVAASIYRKE
ncbi:MAG: CheR family methyltransferase, partial [Limisphaerales bacterium]